MVVTVIMLVVFFAVMIGVGVYCHRQATDVKGFVLGGRNVGPWLTAFAYGTSYFSAVIFVGYAGQFGWKFGIASTWIGIGNAVLGSLLAWVVLGRRTRLMTQQLNTSTMPGFFEKRFESKTLKIVASVIVFVFLIPYTASLYNGLSRLFVMAFDGKIDYTWCIVIMSVLTAVYVIAGGYMATAINDFIQGVIMLVGIVAVIWAVLEVNGGLGGSLQMLAQVSGDGPAEQVPGAFSSFFGPDLFFLFFVIILTSLGTWGLPQMVQKFYSIKSEGDIKKGTIISTVFAVIVAGGCYFLGGFGRIFATPEQVATEGFDSIIPSMIKDLSPVLIGLVVVLVLSASMSTLSSLVLTSSSTLTLDLIKGNIVKNMDEKKQLSIMRIFVVVFIVISACIAIFQVKSNSDAVKYIAQLMGVSWGALAGAFLAPFLYGLYWKKTTKAACFASFAFGVGVMMLNLLCKNIFPANMQTPLHAGVFAMVGGLIIVPVVSLVTPKPDKEKVEEMFACYDVRVEATAKKHLGE